MWLGESSGTCLEKREGTPPTPFLRHPTSPTAFPKAPIVVKFLSCADWFPTEPVRNRKEWRWRRTAWVVVARVCQLLVVAGGRGRGHDGVRGDRQAQVGVRRGAGGRRQGQPLTTSAGLFAAPAVFLYFLVWDLFWPDCLSRGSMYFGWNVH